MVSFGARGVLILTAGLVLIAADNPPPRKPSNAERIATQPVRDVDARRTKIPPALAEAAKDPYSQAGLRKCKAMLAEVDRLSDELGPDFATGMELRENRAARLAEAGGKTIVNSLIPFRGLVREITGAAPAQRRLDAAIDAGNARRGFIRGLMAARGCKAKDQRKSRDAQVGD